MLQRRALPIPGDSLQCPAQFTTRSTAASPLPEARKKQSARAGVTRRSGANARGATRKAATRKGGARKVAADKAASVASVAPRVQRGLRETAAILLSAVALYLLLALLSFHPSDAGWSHTGGHGRIANAGGRVGAWFADISLYLLGYVAWLLPLLVAYTALVVYRERHQGGAVTASGALTLLRWIGLFALLLSACGLAAMHFLPEAARLPVGVAGGGVLGTVVADLVIAVFNPLGSTLLLLAVFLVAVTLFTGLSWFLLMDLIGDVTLRALGWLFGVAGSAGKGVGSAVAQQREAARERAAQPPKAQSPKPRKPRRRAPDLQIDEAATGASAAAAEAAAAAAAAADQADAEVTAAEVAEAGAAAAAAESKTGGRQIDIKPPQFDKQIKLFDPPPDAGLPPISLLDDEKPEVGGYSAEALTEMSRLLEEKLADFGVKAEVVAVHPGPVITRFELHPAPGVKASRITNLARDLARSLSVIAVRVVEVIPGKSTVGLEIPNAQRELVRLSEIIRSKQYDGAKSPLTIGLGKDISGKSMSADLAKMPHLLVAGTTGSGKSVAVNAMLLSLLYKARASEVRMILIDPKMLELNVYEGIPHLLAPVVTDMKEAANALRWCVGEMERRYRLMAAMGVRNIAGFNKKVREAIERGEPIVDPLYEREKALDPSGPPPTLEPLPYIVVVVDEFADMMMVVGKKVEELIARIAQKARAAGIHLILATQRPSVDVITGLIKANIPTRMAFQVSSKVDSRTILDQQGAETLLGHGDMLFLPPGTAQPVRVHGAFVDDHEVHAVVEHLKSQGEAEYIDEILEEPTTAIPGLSGEPAEEGGEQDALYDQAVQVVTESRKASISYVQRRLKIGYNRAARMIEEMEQAGVVSPVQANGSREVLAPPPPPA